MDFPTTPGALNPTKPGGSRLGNAQDAFVTKLAADGSSLQYSTYLGGTTSWENGNGIAVDEEGNAFVCGQTDSSDFPVTPGAWRSPSGGLGSVGGTAYAAKLSPDGRSLVYSSIVGGFNALALALDSNGNAYIAGDTFGPDIVATPDAPQPTYGGGRDAFVVKLNATGTALVFATYLGGTSAEQGVGIAVDSVGKTHVVGITTSANFPTVNPLRSACNRSAPLCLAVM